MSEPLWIMEPAALAAHQRLLSEHGGRAGVDRSRLADALQAPVALWQANATLGGLVLAVAYAEAVIRFRPFASGNVALAYLLATLFLKLNGVPLLAPKVEKFIMMRAFGAGRVNARAFLQWLTARNQPDQGKPRTLIHVHVSDRKVKRLTIVRSAPSGAQADAALVGVATEDSPPLCSDDSPAGAGRPGLAAS